MPKYKTLMYSSHDGLLLCFRGLRDELQELNGEVFPVGTVLNITEEDTDRTKTFAITNLEPFSYDNTPYSETVRSATTDDIRVLHDRIDNLEERITKLEGILSMTTTRMHFDKDGSLVTETNPGFVF